MKIEEEVVAAQRKLDEVRGMRAILWSYSVSRSTLQVRLQRPGLAGNTHLVCEACRRLESPDAWEDANLVVRLNDDDPTSGSLVVQDSTAGFRVVCKLVLFATDVSPVH